MGLTKKAGLFGGTLYAQDFARMVSEIPEVRHVVNVQLYDMANRDVRDPSGWEEGLGESEIILENQDLFTPPSTSGHRGCSEMRTMLTVAGDTGQAKGAYQYLANVVQVKFPVRAARSYLMRHLANRVQYRLVEVRRGEELGMHPRGPSPSK